MPSTHGRTAAAASTAATTTLDGVAAIRQYVDRIVTGDEKCHGMKVLLLDAATTQIVSAVYSQTEILDRQVYLVSRLDKDDKDDKDKKKKQQHQNGASSAADLSSSSGSAAGADAAAAAGAGGHLKAVCFVRPTARSVELLSRELAAQPSPRYSEYHVYFSGVVPPSLLQLLAESDCSCAVKQVQEMYADFCPVNDDCWTLNCRLSVPMTVAAGTSWAPKHAAQYERNLTGLLGMLLAVKRQPACIRYAGKSPCAEELARDVHDAIGHDDIYHFRRHRRRPVSSAAGGGGGNGGGLMLLVLDRRDDPVTPLLSQWTYQAMVHELLGLNNHRVLLKGAPAVGRELEEVVLNAAQDDFFAANRYSNFGQLGEEVQKLLQEYQKQTAAHTTENLNSIEEMQAFMEKFPELRSRSHVVSKHVAIVGELARLVDACSLMDVSQLEQDLACRDDMNQHWREVLQRLESPDIKLADKLRLGLLYALRYERTGNVHMLLAAMNRGGVPADLVDLVAVMIRYAGCTSRGPGLYGDSVHMNQFQKMTKNFISTVQGCENVYAQHVPVLMDTITAVCKGKLSYRTHPVVAGSTTTGGGGGGGSSGSHNNNGGGSATTAQENYIPDEILVFIVGGITYEEATKVAEFNRQQQQQQQQQHYGFPGAGSTGTSAGSGGVGGGGGSSTAAGGGGRCRRVILAGSTIHNSTSFLDELKSTTM